MSSRLGELLQKKFNKVLLFLTEETFLMSEHQKMCYVKQLSSFTLDGFTSPFEQNPVIQMQNMKQNLEFLSTWTTYKAVFGKYKFAIAN